MNDGHDSRAEARQGFLDVLPLLVAAIPFALVLGALAAQKGLSPFEVLLMGTFVYAGGAQFVAVGMWETPAPVASIVLATAAVNLRHVLMGAALESVPSAILAAIVAPALLAVGPAEALAGLSVAMLARRAPGLVAIVAGVALVVVLRRTGL